MLQLTYDPDWDLCGTPRPGEAKWACWGPCGPKIVGDGFWRRPLKIIGWVIGEAPPTCRS